MKDSDLTDLTDHLRLLNEVQARVEKHIIAQWAVDNRLEHSWHIIDDPGARRLRAFCKLRINAEDYDFDLPLSLHELDDPGTLAKKFAAQVGEKVAEIISPVAIREAMTRTRTRRP